MCLKFAKRWTKCKYFVVISIDLLLVFDNKYYLQVYLDNCASEILDNQTIDYRYDNLCETDEN